MSKRRLSLAVGVLYGLAVLLVLVGLSLMIGTLDEQANIFGFRGATELLALTFASVGGVLASRRPSNPIGWIFVGVGLTAAVQVVAQEYAVYAIAAGEAPGAALVRWVDTWIWIPVTGAVGIHVFLLFPTGRPPSPRWRWILWTGTLGIALFTIVFAVGSELDTGVVNPFFEVGREITGPGIALGALLYLGSVAAAAASLIVRFRRARGDERQQVRWFATAAALVAISLTTVFIAEFGFQGIIPLARAAEIGVIVSFVAIPVTTGIAILKYRLYELDVVISRTVLYGALVVFVTLVYVAIVIGLGTVVGTRGNVFLSIVATAVIAVAFHPARERARRLANRLVYGKRATPYEVLSEFGERLAGSYATDDVLPRLARVVGEGVGATRSRIWLRVGGELRRVGGWPADDEGRTSVDLPADRLPSFDGEDRAFEVRHQGELLGAITASMPPQEALTPAGEKLLQDLAAHAGLILKNVRLIEELRASRQRIVAAQDEERRRLERNIHDGAQQQLVALSVKARLAETFLDRDLAKAKRALEEIKFDTGEALENLRDLARGVYPPLLSDKGLAAALESQARKATIPVSVEPNGVGRYPQEAEAAAYFCVLEALQNVAKYADATGVTVRLGQEDGLLVFSVADDGKGFDPAITPAGSGLQNMKDRVEALGGTLEIRSEIGAGTVVTGRVPIQSEEVRPAE
jgi:signal transduction histidine kinase